MSYLLIGDLHLTDRPRDAYRFDIFKWIVKQQAKYKPEATFIMGDLCDQKDRHSAALVNRIVDELGRLSAVYILMGNHDYIDPKTPFFKFLSKLKGVFFFAEPCIFGNVAVIPHCREQDRFDAACEKIGEQEGRADYLLVHNTFSGAISETGKELSGFSTGQIQFVNPKYGVFAGDIHRPQHTDNITYVGSPYHIRFGDDFEPRCLLLERDLVTDLHFDCPRKWKLAVRDADEILKDKRLLAGDQVKITVELAREEAVEWQNYRNQIKDACERKEFEVFGIDLKVNTFKKKNKDVKVGHDPVSILGAFCKSEGTSSQIHEAGLSILKNV